MKPKIENNSIPAVDHHIDDSFNLFDLVPCIITVQDKTYKILKYNREFTDKFASKKGDYCFQAYKGRNEKCPDCPLEKTFQDGKIHFDEQSGVNKDGTPAYWIVKTSPIRNSDGEIIAAMEMSINITQRILLQEKLKKTEKKYQAIFNSIPNSVFVLDADTLEILDCNNSVESNYGYAGQELIHQPFMNLFKDKEKFESRLKIGSILNKVRHRHKDGSTLYTDIRISPSEYDDRKVFIIACSNITQTVETEKQLVQAAKLTTLGEMATGIAHELNQPLSVMKSASTFIMKKTKKQEAIEKEILLVMLSKIDSNIDRASKIINRMRQFSRKSSMEMEKIQVNEVLNRAFQIFNEQLKLRGIEVIRDLYENLPEIEADPNCLEQVFINLVLNARDAIEAKWGEKWKDGGQPSGSKQILIKTRCEKSSVIVEIHDTGTGIKKEIADKIFEPFFTTKQVGKGTGLGLSISYGLIKDCGGQIYADTGRDDGATFIINFPRKSVESW